MNPSKSDLFLAGYTQIEAASTSAVSGLKLGTLPTRYLGLPLNSVKLTFSGLQPFLERISGKVNSWAAKSLSYAGKVRLVASVIYGMVNFWSQVFLLPKKFYKKVDSICCKFLWGNVNGIHTNARVAWSDLCRPKEEGGVGLRRLEDFQIVFHMKRVWELFDRSESLWIAWVKKKVIKNRSYWTVKSAPRFSWTINKMLAIKDQISSFIRCKIGNGNSASFWHDHWLDYGPLIKFLSVSGPSMLRIPIDAVVSDAVVDGAWNMPNARSDQIEQLLIQIVATSPPNLEAGSDQYLWKSATNVFKPDFNTKNTWSLIRDRSPLVSWCKAVWFPRAIPRCSFIHWLAALGRLPTRDRLISWGLVTADICPLCKTNSESHAHLFYACNYVQVLWNSLMARVVPNCPSQLQETAEWLSQTPSLVDADLLIVAKLINQVIIYSVWRERNLRIFTQTESSTSQLVKQIDATLRARLISIPHTNLARPQLRRSLLETYFASTL